MSNTHNWVIVARKWRHSMEPGNSTLGRLNLASPWCHRAGKGVKTVYYLVCGILLQIILPNLGEHRELCCALGQCSLLPALGLWWLGYFIHQQPLERGRCQVDFLLFMHLQLTSADWAYTHEKGVIKFSSNFAEILKYIFGGITEPRLNDAYIGAWIVKFGFSVSLWKRMIHYTQFY